MAKLWEVTVNIKEENSEDFCLDFVLEFSLCRYNVHMGRMSSSMLKII
jgi:hypothetical protein